MENILKYNLIICYLRIFTLILSLILSLEKKERGIGNKNIINILQIRQIVVAK